MRLRTAAALLLLLGVAHAAAKPDAKPKARPQDPNEEYRYEDYGEYGDYGEDFYGGLKTQPIVLSNVL